MSEIEIDRAEEVHDGVGVRTVAPVHCHGVETGSQLCSEDGVLTPISLIEDSVMEEEEQEQEAQGPRGRTKGHLGSAARDGELMPLEKQDLCSISDADKHDGPELDDDPKTIRLVQAQEDGKMLLRFDFEDCVMASDE